MSTLPNSAAQQAGAADLLGSAVEDFTRRYATDVASGRFSTSRSALNSAADSVLASSITSAIGSTGDEAGGRAWQSSQYSEDLIKYAPKSRFIFKVKFVFNAPYTDTNTEFSFVVRNIDRPTVNFEYDEVNMYNFRTKVLRTIVHEPLNMAFHDDIQNKVLDFFNFYRTTFSPVSNLSVNEIAMMNMENAGMSFKDPAGDKHYAAASGVLKNNQKNLLRYIELSQVYAHGSRVNKFFFINPKIQTFDFDNVDHENSDGNAMTVSFSYDSLYVEDDAQASGTPSPIWGKNDVMGNAERAERKELPHLTGGDTGVAGKTPPASGGIPQIQSDTFGGRLGNIALGAGSSWLSNQASTTINNLVKGSNFGKTFGNAAGAASTALGGIVGNTITEGASATAGLVNTLIASSNSDDGGNGG